jgi:hypothetical protein
MRKKYLVQAVLCSLLGANVALAQDQAPAPAAPLSPEEAAGLHDKLRTMSPEERREYLDEQHEKMREQAEASMPVPAGSEEMKERHEKLKEMTPEERRAYLQQESEQRRAEAEAAMPVPPVPPLPGQAGLSEPTAPSAQETKQRHEKLKAMAPEERREYLRAESEQKRQEAEAAMPSPPAPPPVFGGAPEPVVPSAEEVKARHEQLKGMTPEQRRAQLQKESEQRRAEVDAGMPVPPMPPAPLFGAGGQPSPGGAAYEKLRSMTPEQRRAYRNERYQELRRQAAAEGLDLPEAPPWAQQPPPGIRYMSDDERTEHWEKMSEMTPEERAVYRAEHHQRMMERAQGAGQEAPQIPDWVKQQQEQAAALQKKIDAMSPEDKEACFAMQRLMRGPGMGRRWGGPAGPGADYPVGPGVRSGYPPAGAPELPPPGGPGDYTPEPYAPGYGYGPGYGWGRGYGPGAGYGQDYPPAPNYGYGPQSGPRPGY